jgi:adenine deaminase
MATIQAAECFGLNYVGAIAPGYRADVLVLDDLDSVKIRDVYSSGKKVVDGGEIVAFDAPKVSTELEAKVLDSFCLDWLYERDFHIEEKSRRVRVIDVLPGQIITNQLLCDIDWSVHNGIDTERDILKLAVIERHHNTGLRGLGFIHGIGLKYGAIASSVSHDSHNIIVIGTNDADMAFAANCVRESGGNVVVVDGEVIAEMPLPVAGLMTQLSGEEIAAQNREVREAVYKLGAPRTVEPFMNMAFVSLPVIPSLKMSASGLVDVDKFCKVSLYVEEE